MIGNNRKAAVIGCGVIGAGWVARFLLNGWDVSVFDPDSSAERQLVDVLDNARAALPGLSDRSVPREGRLTTSDSLDEVVSGACWIQESVPERLDIKKRLIFDLADLVSRNCIVASSTSGFRPSVLAEDSQIARQIMVCHPFNPVYLLPLVEVVGHEKTDPELLVRANRTLSELGMRALQLRKEVDAHLADRLMEAVWREALWLVRDGVATTEEIDESIRLGFGLRWAQMGLFETFRIAGGDAGMEHFLTQFGPCLEMPWTRLTDVPELTAELVRTITEQSDAQSSHLSIRELERIRDGNLVAVLRALKGRNWGAGAVLNAHDSALDLPEVDDCSEPVRTISRAVPLDWTDYNGHMNEARYLQAFGDATDRFMEIVGCDAEYISAGNSYFTVETHIRHIGELLAGNPFSIDTICLQGEPRKMRLFHQMENAAGEPVATGEHLLLHVDLQTRRTSPARPQVMERLKRIAELHSGLDLPEGVGRAVGQRP